jgi:uncharacterized membrane protein YgaE (UPF0421/DUF939 family)
MEHALPQTTSSGAWYRIRAELKQRLKRWQSSLLPVAQAALAAGLAWLVGIHVAGHHSPFFAPIAAVIVLGVTLGQRLRRGIELVVGVTVGIAIGDLLIPVIGTGPWQIALAVALAMSAATLIDRGAIISIQAAVSAVLAATLYLPLDVGGVDRIVDALIGGVAGLLVVALVPPNPLAVVRQDANRLLTELADLLRAVAVALRERDAEKAAAVLARSGGVQQLVDDYRTALEASTEITTVAPLRWRYAADLRRYAALVRPVDSALRNVSVLSRRAGLAVRDGEPIPGQLTKAIETFADSIMLVSTELGQGKEPIAARARMEAAAKLAGTDMIAGKAFSTTVVLAQLRSATVDMLQALGMTRNEALATFPTPMLDSRSST